jgi:hypothetical protein
MFHLDQPPKNNHERTDYQSLLFTGPEQAGGRAPRDSRWQTTGRPAGGSERRGLEDKERSGSRAVPVMVAAGECLESTEKKPRQARVRMPASPVCFG